MHPRFRALVTSLLHLLVILSALTLPVCAQAGKKAAPPAQAGGEQPERPPSTSRSEFQGPTGGQMNLGSDEGFGFGTLEPDPTALFGPTRIPVLLPGNYSLSTVSLPVYLAVRPAPAQRILLEAAADLTQLGADLSWSWRPASGPGVLTANVFTWRARTLAFEGGPVPVGLLDPRGAHPWTCQVGGGVEYALPLSPELRLAAALGYRQVTVQSGAFTGQVTPVDQLGDPLTMRPNGTDQLLSARVVGLYSTLDNLQFPTRGTKLRFGFDQTLPIGPDPIHSTRLSGNWTQFFDVGRHGQSLIFNLQSGLALGDVPPYDAYALGGVNSVRGWSAGALGAAQGFVESTLEYRFPLGEASLFGTDLKLRGAMFIDFADDFDSQGKVHGRPGLVRGKPGNGAGGGVGLHVQSPVGLIRLEGAVTGSGVANVYLTVGDRY